MMKVPLFEIAIDLEGIFLERLNKFLGVVEINGVSVLAHIHDPGRLEGLLEKGKKVLLKKVISPKRKTEYEVIAVKINDETILVNSRYHNDIAESLIRNGIVKFGESKDLRIKREFKFQNSRFDFLVEGNSKYLVEVKGCVLVRDGIALFPDAPTKRGARHLLELVESISYGFTPKLFILILRNASAFKPNGEIDKDFENNFYYALMQGVEVKKFLLSYNGRFVYFIKELPSEEN